MILGKTRNRLQARYNNSEHCLACISPYIHSNPDMAQARQHRRTCQLVHHPCPPASQLSAQAQPLMVACRFESNLADYDVCSNWGNWVHAAGLTGGRVNKFNISKQSRVRPLLHGTDSLRGLPAPSSASKRRESGSALRLGILQLSCGWGACRAAGCRPPTCRSSQHCNRQPLLCMLGSHVCQETKAALSEAAKAVAAAGLLHILTVYQSCNDDLPG